MIKSDVNKIPDQKYTIYKLMAGKQLYYAVREYIDNIRGGGDTLWETQEEAQIYADELKNQDEERRICDEEKEKNHLLMAEIKEMAENLGDYTNNMTKIQIGKIKKILSRQIRYCDGDIMSRRDKTQKRVKIGAKTDIFEENNKNIQYLLDGHIITKTEYDYANYLIKELDQ